MSNIAYGAFQTDFTRTALQRQVVLAPNGTYLGTDWLITSEGAWNPGVNAWLLPGVGQDPVDVRNQGVFPTVTDQSLREYLLTPRRQLVVTNGFELLRSPDDGTVCDAANGPTPLRVDVTQVHGTRTFRVYFVVKTRVNEAKRFTSQPSILLSNSWAQRCVTDQDHYSRVTTTGRAVFRRDLLEKRGVKPDDFRGWLVGPPCPVNFQRCQVNVDVAENGYEVAWQTLDIEKPYNLLASGITRIEAFRDFTLGWGGLEGIGWGAVKTVGLGGLEHFGDVADLAATACPQSGERIVVRVWGNRNATKQRLRDVCEQMIEIYVNVLGVAVETTSAAVSEDLVGTFCQQSFTMKRPPLSSLFNTLKKGVSDGGGGAEEEQRGITTKAEFPNPVLPNHGNTRGTALGQLVASSLATPYQVPPQPPAPGQANNFAPP